MRGSVSNLQGTSPAISVVVPQNVLVRVQHDLESTAPDVPHSGGPIRPNDLKLKMPSAIDADCSKHSSRTSPACAIGPVLVLRNVHQDWQLRPSCARNVTHRHLPHMPRILTCSLLSCFQLHSYRTAVSSRDLIRSLSQLYVYRGLVFGTGYYLEKDHLEHKAADGKN